MRQVFRSCVLALAAITLLAAGDEPSWKNKSISDWDAQDANALLTDSPWAKKVDLEQVRNLSGSERRDGGDWNAGAGRGVGLAGTGIFGSYEEVTAERHAHEQPDLGQRGRPLGKRSSGQSRRGESWRDGGCFVGWGLLCRFRE